ncbi:MAG: hypothetical protein A3F10_07220 [Coxiella sp. RIFCSPHIGHO2_12_FULL_42_15]|nr:MAG: hypothetical protein A3F10_07220 [Coxiella sp. RIFCSPHIGHO2_12_FULL_42_15]
MTASDRKLIWLASYPKSGNTWFRVFLSNLQKGSDEPIHINQLQTGRMASARAAFDWCYAVDSSLFTLDEIDLKRPAVYNSWARAADDTAFHKVHDAYTFLDNAKPLLGDPGQQAAIYLVRNPLDVCVSFAHHNGHQNFDKTIAVMADVNHQFASTHTTMHQQFRQRLLSWSRHVLSWVEDAKMPVHIVRYEDMLLDGQNTFEKICQFAGLNTDSNKIAAAMEASSIEKLQAQESSVGFKEKPSQCRAFFRSGCIGSYKNNLNQQQIDKIVDQHQSVMRRLNYLDDQGLRY